MKNHNTKLSDAFHNAENNLTVDAVGRGNYAMDGLGMAPNQGVGLLKKPQTPAQHDSSVKAAKVSAQNRKARAGTMAL